MLCILKKVVNETGHDWHLNLNPTLWDNQTNIQTSMGATLDSLVYGAEEDLPIEVELPSLCIYLKDFVSNEDYRVERLVQLDLLDGQHQKAYDHMQIYQICLKRQYQKKVHHREFEVGDLVLRENPQNQQDFHKKRKFEANWLGPYVIIEKYGSRAYQLSMPEGEPLTNPLNILHLNKFYA